MEDIFNYKRSDEEDYYLILGCSESSTVEQICAEYKIRALQLHPDKNPGDSAAEAKFQLVQEAKETLTDPEKRKNYDKWRNSGITISYKNWRGMKDHVHQSMHWATPKTAGRMLPCDSKHSHSSVVPEENLPNSDIVWGRDSNDIGWKSETSHDVMKKFRNYEI